MNGLAPQPRLSKIRSMSKTMEKIDWLLKRDGITQTDFAAAIHRHPSRVSKWKDDKGAPTPEDVVRIADFFHVTVRYLCDDAIGVEDDDAGEQPGTAAAVEELTDLERHALFVIRTIGVERAMERLLVLSRESGQPQAVVPTVTKLAPGHNPMGEPHPHGKKK